MLTTSTRPGEMEPIDASSQGGFCTVPPTFTHQHWLQPYYLLRFHHSW
ncbi:hypothetical protein CORMATOL_01445 [Corynebacterium matruchotii ATCC 33806]|uniref:Uncharacterized protein n=1 Tax=Corynebacterium matruchotii ATCC 33806 TaxID=566549 RepID=C0E383_9CORY|nr:hypothetical protein CORMATOL_01445 [Corynebacterium matruchotii ATCC 33806]